MDYKHQYESAKKMVTMYQDEIVPGLREKIKELEKQMPTWIPESEPPKEWRDENGDAINYLIYTPGLGIDIGNWIEPAKAWFCLGVPFKVTHWMPLPEPPKENADEVHCG